MAALKLDFEHRPRQNSGNCSLDLDGLVFTFIFGLVVLVRIIATSPATSTASSAKISWLSDNEMGCAFITTGASGWREYVSLPT
ncbi:hypothetical protein N9A94_05110 [Akkermansiaceae bacterium]|nr:hypothetical protein [Akkermansiaceae bacterium]